MTAIIAAGGTGGHLYPGMALATAFRSVDPAARVVFIGTEAGLETRLLPENGFELRTLAARGWVGKGVGGRVAALLSGAWGLFQAIGLLRQLKPAIVIGIGGYASGPTLVAAILLRIRRIVLEPNLVPGLANRLLAPYVDRVVVAFEAARSGLSSNKILCLGTPVRAEIARARHSPRKGGPMNVLVLGGSQGSHAINRAMIEALPHLAGVPVRILHQTGRSDEAAVAAAYAECPVTAKVVPYIEKMAEAYAEADIVIGRAGAGTLAEVAAVGLPAIFIPYPHAGAHQEKNAAVFVDAGAGEMIRDRDLTGAYLAERVRVWANDPARRCAMAEAAAKLGRPDAAEEIVRLCRELAENR